MIPRKARRQPVILIVDGTTAVRDLLNATLRGLYGLVELGEGTGALEAVREHRPDAVILEILLPDISGIDICEAIRADPVSRGIPIVVLSTQADPRVVEKARATGADEFMKKPFSPLELLQLLEHLLDRPTPHRASG